MSRAFQRAVAVVESIAAAVLFIVTVLSFSAVIARYVFNTGLPDAFDGARYLLGVVIFWGLASACHRGDNITMDAVWALSPKPVKWLLDVFSNTVVTIGLAFLLWKFTEKVIDTWNANHGTIDLDLPVAAFYALAWVGLLAAQIFSAARLLRILRGREDTPTEAPVHAAD